jgi:CRP-like cAMP-binding protein
MNATESKRRKHLLTDKMKVLSAKALAQKIGYLQAVDFPDTAFDSLPRLSFNPSRHIKSKDNLYLVKSGSVIIKHAHYEYFIKDLSPGALFGNLPLLGQTMLGTEALAGSGGATLGVVDRQRTKRIVETNPIGILDKLGSRLSSIETDHYRVRFQLADSRLAALILNLSGEAPSVEGLSHEELGEMLGIYRETVTTSLGVM